MSTSTLNLYLRHLALSPEVRRLGTASDHHLLAAYESERGQAAFTELMRRHGPMVLRTCRRILGRGPDAEDAFQATFVLLARKAGRLRRETAGPLSLGGWLHRVAYQTARDVLRGAVRRRDHERQASVMTYPDHDPSAEATWNEIQPILDAELDALPDEARRLLIACCLQEKTHTEAAAELGMPRSSLVRRLEKARALLAVRLARRGITVSAALLAVLLEESAKGSGVPAVLLVHTVEAAQRFTLHLSGALSDNVARLVKGGLGQMAKGWTHLSMVLAAWVGLLGAGLLTCQTLKAWPDQKPEQEPQAAAAEQPAQKGDKSAHTDRYGDPLPAGALVRMGTTRLRHAGRAAHVFFAPDGKTVASAGTDRTVRLWDVATGKLVRSLEHPPLGVFKNRHPEASFDFFARDGRTLVSATQDRIWLWDVRTGKGLRELKLKLEPPDRGVSLRAISSDGKMAASSDDGANKVVRLWDVATGNPLGVLDEHEWGSIRLLSFSPDNKTLAWLAYNDKVVRLWDIPSGKLLQKLGHPQVVEMATVSFSPDGKMLASGGEDKSIQKLLKPGEGNRSAIRLWDVATGKLLRTLEGHQDGIHSLSFSPDGKIVASWAWGLDRTIRLWDVTAGKELRKLKCQDGWSLSFSPDGKVLASGGLGPAVRLWDVTTGEELHRSEGAHKGQVSSVSFSPDGRALATVAARWWREEEEGTVRIWDAASGKPLRKLKHPEERRSFRPIVGVDYSVAFAPDGKTLALGGEGMVRIWDVAAGKQMRKLEARNGGSPLAFSPDGKLLAAGFTGEDSRGGHRTLRLWDVATGTQLHALEHSDRIESVAFSPDGKTLAVATGMCVLYLWDAVTGKELLKLDSKSKDWFYIVALSFSPDGKTLAVGSRDGKIHLLEVSTGKGLCTLTDHSDPVLAVAFSPNGRWLASGGADRTVRLWEVNAGRASEYRQFRGHAAQVTAVAFSPDGRRLASGSHDSTALVWDVTGLAGGQTGPTGRQTRVARLTGRELAAYWQSLASTDAPEVYQALRALGAVPDQAVPFLAERLLLKKPDPQKVARLLADLDSEEFRVRSKAAKELEKWGEAGEPALRQALKSNPSVEVRRRIQQLLEEKIAPEGVLLRRLRAVEVLAWIDTPAARELLKKLATDLSQEEVGREAKAALKHLRALPNP